MSHRQFVLLLLCVFIAFINVGCNDDDDDDKEENAIDWFTCSLVEGRIDGKAECAEVQLPLFYDTDDSRTTPVYVKRLKYHGDAYGQLWLLHGGPGASGVESFGPWMEEIASSVPGLDIYTLDHRGVGGSDRLGCPDQENPNSDLGTGVSEGETDACIAYMVEHWGDALNGITTTASARDVGELINLTREEGQMVFVWGGSYGSYLAHRYMQLFPDQADGVILEGIAPAGTSFVYYDYYFNINGKKLFDQCGEDPLCSGKLGEDPWDTLAELISMMDNGHCAELGVDGNYVKQFLGGMLYYAPIRDLIPATVYRVMRCNEQDIEVIVNLYNGMYGQTSIWGMSPGYSRMLGNHIGLSEMWDNDNPPPQDQLDRYFQEAQIAMGTSASFGKIYDRWPKYPRDQYDDNFANYSAPLLMLHGGYDPATPIENAAIMTQIFNHNLQTFALFPFGAHNVISGTPVNGGGINCGNNLFLQFLRNPNEPLDTSCMNNLKPIDFNGDPAWANYLMGTADVWGDSDASMDHMPRDPNEEPPGLEHLRALPPPYLPDAPL